MTEQEYLREVRQIQAWIASGDDVLRKKAEAAIEPFRHIYPQRLPYLCAEIALMMAHGESAERCRDAVDDLAQEFYPQEGLSDLFMLKSRTYREGSPEWRQLQFIAAFYSSGELPQQPMVELAEMKAAFLRGTLSDKELHDLAVQYYAAAEIVANVPPHCFLPRPKVGSAVICLKKYREKPVQAENETLLFRIIRASFNQRRKTLVNGLKNAGFAKDKITAALQALELPETVRGETLSLAQFAALSAALQA